MHRPLAIVTGLILLAASATCAAQVSRISFTRSTYNDDFSLRASTIYRINADGSGFMNLGALTTGIYRFSPMWSPNGASIAYVYGTSASPALNIYVMTSTGGSRHRVTLGSARHTQPVWSPGGTRIAFIAEGTTGACLGIVAPDGSGQRNLFCPPGPAYIDNTPQWSTDGTRIFISTGFYGPGLEPPYHSRAWSVNATTGAATLLTEQTLEDPRSVYFNPNGTSGLYASTYQNRPIDAVNFATDVLVPRTTGYGPKWNRTGTRFAYTKSGSTGAPDFDSYDHVWVMSADGSTDTEVTMPIVDNIEYDAVKWSRDGTRILTNRTVYAPSSPGSGTYTGTPGMRIFNVATSAFTSLPNGAASDWYQSP
jgi:Tol biopolymer transport system component